MKTNTYAMMLCLVCLLGIQLHAEIREPRKMEIIGNVESGNRWGSGPEEQPFAEWIMTLTPEEKLRLR